jgi:hypothetical protein
VRLVLNANVTKEDADLAAEKLKFVTKDWGL